MTEQGPDLSGTAWEALDEVRFDALLEKLGEAGWQFGGGGNPQTGDIGLGMVVDPDSGRSFTEEELRDKLPVLDDSGEPLEGFNVGTDEDGLAFVEYEGPVDDRFERFVDAAAALLSPAE